MASLPTRQTDQQVAAAYLREVKAAQAAHPERYPADFDWAVDVLEEAWREFDELRERLAELEWVSVPDPVPDARCCPVPECAVIRGSGARHAPDCWLAEAIGVPRDE